MWDKQLRKTESGMLKLTHTDVVRTQNLPMAKRGRRRELPAVGNKVAGQLPCRRPSGGLPPWFAEVWGVLADFGGLFRVFGVWFLIWKMRELKYDILWNKWKKFEVKRAYGLIGVSSQSLTVENGWKAGKSDQRMVRRFCRDLEIFFL